MDYDIELRFQTLTKKLENDFGEGLDTQAILFLIGVYYSDIILFYI